MLKNFRHVVSTRFVFGDDAHEHVGEELKKEGAKKVLIVHDSGKFLYDTGLLAHVEDLLAKSGLQTYELPGVKPNPRLTKVREGIDLVRREKIDWMLAIGGGSSIDTAKAVAAGALYDGDVWDFFLGKAHIEKALPVAVILTLPATGSESGAVSVICNEETQSKFLTSSEAIRPKIAFMNPNLTLSLPPFITACGIADMFSHMMERYFSDDDELNTIDFMLEGLMKALVTFGSAVMKEPKSYRYRAEIMWIGTVAHNNTVGVGRNQDWASHNIANELSALYDTPHGASLSIITPYWMRYVYKEHLWRFVRYADKVFDIKPTGNDEEDALRGIDALEKFFKNDLKLPVCFSDYNIPTDQLEKMSEMAEAEDRKGHIGCFKVLYKEDILKIYKAAAH
ncbi:MAG: iron-containing alcohol dehydrogenase [Oscillospiraceae bacterium]|jgi:alcohol dehydrogenase YqhD (iron-dependent ADH family)